MHVGYYTSIFNYVPFFYKYIKPILITLFFYIIKEFDLNVESKDFIK